MMIFSSYLFSYTYLMSYHFHFFTLFSQYQSTDTLCRQSMEIFYHCYGAEAGLAGLKWLPYGGLYLTGEGKLNEQKWCHVVLICLSVCLSICLSVCLCVCRFTVWVCMCVFVCPYVYLSTCHCTCLCTCLSFFQSILWFLFCHMCIYHLSCHGVVIFLFIFVFWYPSILLINVSKLRGNFC